MFIGALLFFGTTAALLKPAKFQGAIAEATNSVARSSDNEPSWKFRNPDMDQWLEEIKREKDALSVREQQLNDLEARLNAERQEISIVTQTVYQLQGEFDKNVVRLNAQDSESVKRQAKLISAMSPEGAAATLNEMNDDDVVRILFSMKADDASVLLDTLSKMGKDQAKRAANIVERMRQTLPPPTTPSK